MKFIHFTECGKICDSFLNGRGNPIKLQLANNSTPILDRAFFIRSTRTPNQNGLLCLYSMIACDGKRASVGGVPVEAVFPPRHTLSPSRGKQRDNFLKYQLELLAMIYLFLGISRQHYDINRSRLLRIQAESKFEAIKLFAKEFVLIFVGRLPNSARNNRTLTAQRILQQRYFKNFFVSVTSVGYFSPTAFTSSVQGGNYA